MGEAKRRAILGEKISVLIPERGRPAALHRLLASLEMHGAGIGEWEVLVAIDDDDPAWETETIPAGDRVRSFVWPRPKTLGEKLNRLAEQATGGLLWFLANDQVVETPAWPRAMQQVREKLPHGIGVAYARDPLHLNHASYYVLTRRMYERIGFFAPPWFPYWFIDTWMTELGTLMGRLVPVDVDLATPDGRGNCHGLVDLPFWVEFFEQTRPMRVRDAVQLIANDAPPTPDSEVMRFLNHRVDLCRARFAQMHDPELIAEWTGRADSPPGPGYAEARGDAERLMAELRKQAPRRLRVAVCVPSGRTWEATTANCVAALAAYSTAAGIDLAFLNIQTSVVSHARNATVEKALETGVDWVLWIDSDMKFPPDVLTRLLAHGKDIVGATYNKRVPPYETLGKLVGERPAVIGTGLHEALYLPSGMLLVRAEVYRKLGWPWYAEAYRWAGKDGLAAFKALLRDYLGTVPPDDVLASLDGSVFGAWIDEHYVLGERGEPFTWLSEDLFFCRKARRAGLKLWCDIGMTHEMVHLGVLEVTCVPPVEEQAKEAA